MKNCGYKIVLICGLVVFLISQQQIFGQEKIKHIDLNYILVKLTFTSRISKPVEKINDDLIKEIRTRKVDFILTSENEKFIREIGGNNLLIKEIRTSLTEHFGEKSEYEKFSDEAEALYKKYTDNFRGDYEQKKIALKAAKEFIKRYDDEKNIKEEFRKQFKKDTEEIIDYLKKTIPRLESSLPHL